MKKNTIVYLPLLGFHACTDHGDTVVVVSEGKRTVAKCDVCGNKLVVVGMTSTNK